LDPMLDTLGVKPTGQTESPYVWVQRLTPDGRVKWEFKRRDEVMGYNPLPETKEDIAEKMARENRLTGLDLYKALPDLYREDLVRGLAQEEMKKIEEERQKALEEYREEAKGRELESPRNEEHKIANENSEPKERIAEEIVEEENKINIPQELLNERETQLWDQALKQFQAIIKKYPFEVKGGIITKEMADIIFDEMSKVVEQYIKPELFTEYINKYYEDMLKNVFTSSARVNRMKLADALLRFVTNVFTKDHLNPKLLQ
jgi:hypothetical protein